VIAESEAENDSISLATARMVLPFVLACHGEADDAIAEATVCLDEAAEVGGVYLGATYMALMVSHLAANNVELAAEAADAGWSLLGGLSGTGSINSVYIAQTALARGDLVTARRAVDGATDATVGWFKAAALMVRASVAIAEGNPDQAERDAQNSVSICAEFKAYLWLPTMLEIVAGLAAESGNHHAATRLFGAADSIGRRTGEVRLPMYQPGVDTAVKALRNALDEDEFHTAWAEGAALSTEEAIAYAQRGRGERRRPASGWASLTPAELDVVRLVSEGLGNKDIAARLFVSPRTVQSHLTRVYTKLGLSSRVQLAQEAARRATPSNS
jgi:DNA-binding CsgD family transcriptional regulator